MKRAPRHIAPLMLLLLTLAFSFSACFHDPITGPVTEVKDPKPFAVNLDSLSIVMIDNDDLAKQMQQNFVLSTKANYGGSTDTSQLIIDTSKAVPTLTTRLYLTPIFQNDNEVRESKVHQVIIALDSFPITGDDWSLLNNGQVSFVVRTAEKPVPQYSRVHIIQTSGGPYTKDDSFARIIAWKLTAQHILVLQLEMQAVYSTSTQGGPSHDRVHAIAEYRLHFSPK